MDVATDSETETAPNGLPRVFLLPGRDKRWRQGHPWAFSNEIKMDAATKALPPGSPVTLHRVDGKPLGIASFNPHALIAVRRMSDDSTTTIDQSFFAGRLRRALALREKLYASPHYRLVHADADGLPGIIVDRYGDALAVQLNTAGADALLDPLLAALDEVLSPRIIVLQGDEHARAAEGLPPKFDVVKGELAGPVEGQEGEIAFFADLQAGQKTGWFYDQRDNRGYLARLATGGRMLDVYCYGGGFALQAARAGATSVTGVDSSQPALDLAAASAERNELSNKCTWIRSESFKQLEAFAAEKEKFDLVVADPPAFAKNRKSLSTGLRGYRKLARLAAGVVAPGGFLMLCSCSYHVDSAAFAAECARGIAAADRTGRCIRVGGAGADHPAHPHLGESTYLKSMLFQLD